MTEDKMTISDIYTTKIVKDATGRLWIGYAYDIQGNIVIKTQYYRHEKDARDALAHEQLKYEEAIALRKKQETEKRAKEGEILKSYSQRHNISKDNDIEDLKKQRDELIYIIAELRREISQQAKHIKQYKEREKELQERITNLEAVLAEAPRQSDSHHTFSRNITPVQLDKGGRIALGYKRNIDGIPIPSDEAETVRQIFTLRTQGFSLRRIGESVKLSHSTVQQVLRQEALYRGQGKYPAILD